MKQFHIILADLIVIVHLLYVLFAVGGLVFVFLGAGFGWKPVRNPWFRIIHLLAVGLVALEAATGTVCPLTSWEYDLRRLAGDTLEQNVSFLARLARLIIFYNFPGWVFTVVHIVFGLLVTASFILIPPSFRKKV